MTYFIESVCSRVSSSRGLSSAAFWLLMRVGGRGILNIDCLPRVLAFSLLLWHQTVTTPETALHGVGPPLQFALMWHSLAQSVGQSTHLELYTNWISILLHQYSLFAQRAGEKPFECRLCGQRSRDYSAMIKHLRTHGGASPYQCTVCLEFCSSLVAMQRHIKSHAEQDFPPGWSINSTYLYNSHIWQTKRWIIIAF